MKKGQQLCNFVVGQPLFDEDGSILTQQKLKKKSRLPFYLRQDLPRSSFGEEQLKWRDLVMSSFAAPDHFFFQREMERYLLKNPIAKHRRAASVSKSVNFGPTREKMKEYLSSFAGKPSGRSPKLV